MRERRFDTRLIQILTAMAALALMVGIAAIAVNRYLVQSHASLLESGVPAMELASAIGASADLVETLASGLVQADTGDDLDRQAAALAQAVARIEAGMARLAEFGPAGLPPAAAAASASGAGPIVERMRGEGRAALALAGQVRARSAELAADGARLEALVAAGTDLARLRITAGIAGLYAGDGEPAAALDRLADADFFAFERLTELARAVEALRRQVQLVPEADSAGAVAAAQAGLARDLDLATRRIAFLPTAAARREAADLLAGFRAAGGEGGLLVLQSGLLARQAALAADNARLGQVVRRLAAEAGAARSAMQAAQLDRIARAERRAGLLASGLLGLVGLAVAAGGVLWLHARRQVVARLAGVSRRIVALAQGEHGAPVPISGHDEIGRMEKALNILRRRVQEAARLRAHLEEAVIARTGEVVAEMHAADAARAEAEAASRGKTEFLARMSHEIRTPLNGIIGMLALLAAEEVDAQRRERVRIAHRAARDLLALADDILNYAGSEAGAARGTPVHFRLRELVGQIGGTLRALAAEKRLAAGVDLVEPAPQVLLGDVVKIRQVVGNLVSNAVKYTRRGSVTLSVDHAPAPDGRIAVSFTVADTGQGMTREALAHAFDAYARADSARRAGIEGIGLGLAISRNLTEALGGVLSVESAPGVGSRFTLTVPLAPGDPALIAEDEVAPAAGSAVPAIDVLVIDDHAVNRMVARGFLERLGCRVAEAATGAAGVEAAAALRPDLVLVDLDLPDLPGAEVAARIAALPRPPMLAALTAHLIADTAEDRARLGVARVLSKPISPRALRDLVLAAAPGPGAGGAAAGAEADAGADAEAAAATGAETGAETGAATMAETGAETGAAAAVRDSLGGDIADLGAEATGRILAEFLRDLPAATAAILSGPAEDRARAAHRLNGAAANFRLDEFCAVLARIERAGAAADAGLLAEAEARAAEAETLLDAAAAGLGLGAPAAS